MVVCYLVSRFPSVTETFILREIGAVDRSPGLRVELLSLFRAPNDAAQHPEVAPWLERIHRLSPGLAVRGVLWWALRSPGRLAATFARVVRDHGTNPERLGRALFTAALGCAAARQMRRLGVNHVHAHWSTYPTLAAWVANRLTGIPYSFTVHAHDIFLTQAGLPTKIADASFVVAISEFNRQFLGVFTPNGTPVHVIHCGVDPERYPFRVRSPAPSGPVKAVCTASFIPFKGHEVLLRALAGDDPELSRVQLDLVGDGPLRQSLTELAGSLGLDSRVRFLGEREQSEVTALLEQADLMVLPSRWVKHRCDGLPVALIEALACGVPVVSTRVSGIPELIVDGETGLLAEPNDVPSLRSTLRAVLDDPEACEERARRGRALVEREFDIDASAARLVELFGRSDGYAARSASGSERDAST